MVITRKELLQHNIKCWHGWRVFTKVHPGHVLSDDARTLLQRKIVH